MEGKMTILMTTDTVGGVWAYSLELCRALKNYGIKVHLAAMGTWPSPAQQEEAAALENVLLYKSDYKLEWMQDPWDDVAQAGKWLNSIYHTIQPDIIHFNNYAHMGKEWSCPTVTVFHSCVKTWWQAVKGTSAPSTWDKYIEVVQESLNSSDVVVGPTNAILEQAKKSHQITAPTKVIYNGRNMEKSNPGKKQDIILCVGRIWDEAKNLRSLSGIAKNLPWPILVVGSNIHPDTGEEVEIENIHFLGELSQQETEVWMKCAKIFVSPTKYEPFGLAILEAAEAGCALVLSEIDTLKEVWEDNAIFFNPRNKREAENKMLQLIENKSLMDEFAERAQRRSEDFTMEKMASEYYSTYRTLIEFKKTPLTTL